VLTERGRHLLDRLGAYQTGLQTVISDLTDPDNGTHRDVARLGLFIGFSHARLNEFFAGFLVRYPNAAVKVLFLPHTDLAARLVERKLDAALSIYPLQRQRRVLESRRLFAQELILVSGRKHYVANPRLRQIQQLPIVDYYENGERTRTGSVTIIAPIPKRSAFARTWARSSSCSR
jgi:DNA-binding transcriptional LysR family regulator